VRRHPEQVTCLLRRHPDSRRRPGPRGFVENFRSDFLAQATMPSPTRHSRLGNILAIWIALVHTDLFPHAPPSKSYWRGCVREAISSRRLVRPTNSTTRGTTRGWGYFPERQPRFYNHMPAAEVRSKIGRSFDTAFKFCFERHPIDKCLSHYAMLKNTLHHQKRGNPMNW
jgi:hypothetical protein